MNYIDWLIDWLMDLPWLGVCGELVGSELKLGVGIWGNDKN
jgi:hypothetical protein